MLRSNLILLAALGLVFASAPAHAARPRQMQVLDHDTLLLPYVEQDNLHQLTTLRSAQGQILLMDQSAASPIRVAPLGITDGTSNTIMFGEFAASNAGIAYGAFATRNAIRVFSLGDLAAPGPLAPAPLDTIAMGAGFDPGSTHMGIIAILIGLLVDPNVPAVFFVENGQTVVLAWDGAAFRPVHLIEEDGAFYSF